ncbi:TnsA-like heteromeric transposase endonuclease subunit [Mycobacteroides abscessus]|uniref:TnsA-like heteromeric transposase endonuclease subunit n=1 Tax=Mycobacteroides abscessus TaxID=36809 RepID=UPI00067E1CFE|nr:TnsA-like heteromeric transposase endonuclease subunit [Mycobacteroides abscessus]MDM2422521.1 TnsA-like heteromeric transposase endonuclease subunit [Mycobacteroides abscessus]MDM2424292.1 TnsA-like heteromeric transposase endonuclease subunit [Mycobacteroides abscessus]MDM2429524.1 TnsA-like heteromeric transposase endonuclease subunit [Mycobacteroides abscessus]MDM2434508.1 TnsA-like heteromeric transposase endonuclease subunit [Mycobacteroides abscessus]MDM2439789.1 TnsA-like heteromeri
MLTSVVSAGPVGAGVVDLEFDTRAGRLCLALDRCTTFSFEHDCLPVREFPSYRGQRNFPGLWWFSRTGVHVGHESWLERDQLMALDADPDVVGVVSQPFWFRWSDGVSHAPDYFVRRRDGSALVMDVRDDDRITAADQEKFDRSAAECAAVGWDYRRVGVLDPVLQANLRWLSGYRHPRVFRPGLADDLMSAFDPARPLITGVLAVGTPLVVLPVLFHLLWQRKLSADLAATTLTDDTIVSPSAGW